MSHTRRTRGSVLAFLALALTAVLNVGCLSSSSATGALPDGGAFEAGVASPPITIDGAVTVDAGTPAPPPDAATPPEAAPGTVVIGGQVTGLAGSGLVLQNDGGDDLAVTASGTFVFATPIAAGSAYAVTILAQPTGPNQTCTVTSGQGTASSDVTTVQVACVTRAYPVGGVVTGLAAGASGLVLANQLPDGATETAAVAQNGSFAFPTKVPSGAAYAITVATQPTNPSQTCTVSGATGTVVDGAIQSVVVNCAANTFIVGGTVSGLAGQGLVVQNGANTATVNANGAFALSTPVASGASYAVTVKTQPINPSQVCAVTGGSGVVSTGNVSTVQITCTTSAFAIGGAVSGLTGKGLVLASSAGDTLAVTANGPFAFKTPVKSGATFTVTAAKQPTSPWQTCTIAGGSGSVGSGPVTSVKVTCAANSYAVGGTVSGLSGSGLALTLNGGSALSVSASGAFAFGAKLASGTAYTVAVQKQPTGPSQKCTVTGSPTGTVEGGDVTAVVVSCVTNSFAVSGKIVGLTGSGLTLTNEGGAPIAIAAGATTFSFPTHIASGQPYDVEVATNPSGPTQVCTPSANTGKVGNGAVTTVVIDCGTQSFTVSGTVNGLTGSGLQLSDGAGDTIPVGSASFSFALASGTAYTIGVAANPTSPWETCSVTSGATGSVTNANVTGVVVDCTVNPYTVAVDVSGLSNPRFFMSDGTSSVTITGNGTFTFPAVVSSGQTYDVTFTNQPSYQTCSVTSGNASGTMQGASIVVEVACSPPQYPVTIYVEGVPGTQCGSVTLFDGTDQIALSSQPTSETGETFPTYLAPGTSYALSYTGDTLCRCCVVTGTDSSGQPVCASGSITPGAAFDSGTISGPYSTVLTCYELIQ